jgi:hypothetical protein
MILDVVAGVGVGVGFFGEEASLSFSIILYWSYCIVSYCLVFVFCGIDENLFGTIIPTGCCTGVHDFESKIVKTAWRAHLLAESVGAFRRLQPTIITICLHRNSTTYRVQL